MSNVITINIDGQDRNVSVLDTTAHAYGVGTSLTNDLILQNPNITSNSKIAVNIGKAKNVLVSGTINIIQDDDKFKGEKGQGFTFNFHRE